MCYFLTQRDRCFVLIDLSLLCWFLTQRDCPFVLFSLFAEAGGGGEEASGKKICEDYGNDVLNEVG